MTIALAEIPDSSIALHGAAAPGFDPLDQIIPDIPHDAAYAVHFAEGFITWAVTSALDDTIGLGLGLMPSPVTGKIILAVVGVFKGKKAGAEKH